MWVFDHTWGIFWSRPCQIRGMWLHAQRKSRADDGSSLKNVTQTLNTIPIKSHLKQKIVLLGHKQQWLTKMYLKVGILVVSALAEKSTNTLQEGGPVWLMCKQGQKIRSVGRGSSCLKERNSRKWWIRTAEKTPPPVWWDKRSTLPAGNAYLTLLRANSSFCWRSGHTEVTSGSRCSSQSTSSPELSPDFVTSELMAKVKLKGYLWRFDWTSIQFI